MNPPPPANPMGFRFARDEADDAPRLSMAPLVDIVLLLICFYLLVSHAVQTLDDPEVLLPAMAQQQTQEQAPAELVINLRADDSIYVNQQAITLADLAVLLTAEQQGGRASPTVTIRADGRQRYGQLQRILRACREAGLAAVVLRASEVDEP